MGKNLVIFKSNGSKIDVTNYLESFVINKELMQLDSVEVTLNSDVPLDIDVYDYIVVENQKYTINIEPSLDKISNTSYDYSISFEGAIFELRDVKFFDIDKANNSFRESFDLIGDFDLYVRTIVQNLSRKFGANISVKNFVNDIDRQITFNNDDCLSALVRICEAYNKEFFVYRENGIIVIDFISIGREFPIPLAYGYNKGLYQLNRASSTNNDDLCNKGYVRGGTTNIPMNYRGFKDELLMPKDINAAYARLKAEVAGYNEVEKEQHKYLVDFVNDPSNKINSDFFVDDVALAKGLKEKFIRIEDVYPNRTGTIDYVANEARMIGDSTMFDLNAKDDNGTKYLVAGKKAILFVKSGNLGGYSFEISNFDNSKKIFTLMPYKAQNGDAYPSLENEAYQFKIGDTYTLLEINLPDSYLSEAEYELFKKAASEFQILKSRKRQYTLFVDDFFANELSEVYGFFVKEGDYVDVIDQDLGINDKVRVKGYSYDVLTNQYTINLSDTIVYNVVASNSRDISRIESILQKQGIDSVNKSRSGIKSIAELRANIFDTDGYFDMDNIKPLSIDTALLSVGARSQYISTNLVFNVNFQNNPNRISYTSASLFSQTLDRVWALVGREDTMPDSEFRYVYCKANKNAADSTLLFTKDKIEFDSNPTHYHFLLGTLHSVVEGKRILSLTYGSTTIQGGLIKTGRISSNDGKTIFDLDNGVITGKITFTADSPAFEQIDDKIKEATDDVVNEINEQIKNLDKSSEAFAIAQNVPRLNSEKSGLDARYNEVYNNIKLAGSAKTDLSTKKVAYGTAFTNVVSYVNAIISDKEITDDEKIELNKRMVAYDVALGALTKSLEVADAYINTATLKDAKDELNSSIKDVKDDLDSAEKSLNDAIKDGVITAQERAELKAILNSLDSAKEALDKRVAYALTLNVDNSIKDFVIGRNTAFTNSHNSLKNTIELVLNKSDISNADLLDVRNKFKSYNTALANLDEALDKLIQNAQDKAIGDIYVGGSNLLKFTNTPDIKKINIGGLGDFSVDNNGVLKCIFTDGSANNMIIGYNSISGFEFKKDEFYTLTFSFKSDKGFSKADYCFLWGADGNTNLGIGNIDLVSNGIWNTIKHTFKVDRDIKGVVRIGFDKRQGNNTLGSTMYLHNFKLERGKISTDWSPASSDIEYNIIEATDNLKNEVNGAIKDGIINEAESQAIGAKLSALISQKATIDAQYNEIYVNLFLKGSAKTDLLNKKNAYNAAYSSLYYKITDIVNSKIVSIADKAALTNLFDAHDKALYNLFMSLDVARQNIENNKIDNIDVGGTNLLKKSNNITITNLSNNNKYYQSNDGVTRVVPNSSTTTHFRINEIADITDKEILDKECVISFYGNGKGVSMLSKDGYTVINGFTENPAIPSFVKVSVKLKGLRYTDWLYPTIQLAAGGWIYLTKVKIEKGNVATDWSPAPEDLEDEIAKATDNLKNEVNGAIKDGIINEAESQAIGAKLSALQTQKSAVDAQYNELYSNINLKGSAKTDLLNKKTLYNTAYTNLVNKINAVVSAKVVSDADKNALNNLFNSHDIALSNVLKSLDVARQSIEDEKINNIVIGGSNILKKSSVDNFTKRGADSKLELKGNILKVSSLVAGSVTGAENYSSLSTFSKDEEVTISFLARGKISTGNMNYIYIMRRESGGNLGVPSIRLDGLSTTIFTRYSATIKMSWDTNTGYALIGFRGAALNDWFEIKDGVKIERGNVATDWSPAPEDLGIDMEEIENLKNTTARISKITSFLDTTIDGNVVASGTFLVGDAKGNLKAGMTGVAGSVASQQANRRVVFWGGGTFANRENAPFQIWDDGKLVANNASIKGNIEATTGKIASFTIAGEYITTEKTLYANTKSTMQLGAGGLNVVFKDGANEVGSIDTTGNIKWGEIYDLMSIKSKGVSSIGIEYSSLFLESVDGYALKTKGGVSLESNYGKSISISSWYNGGLFIGTDNLTVSGSNGGGTGFSGNWNGRKFINGILVQ